MKKPKSYIFFQDSTLVMREIQCNGEASEDIKLFLAGMCVAIRNILQIKDVFFVSLYCDKDNSRPNLIFSSDYIFSKINMYLYKEETSDYKKIIEELITAFTEHVNVTKEQKLQLDNLYNSNY
jgi:hypothetical protein